MRLNLLYAQYKHIEADTNCHHFAVEIFKCILLGANYCNLTKILLICVDKGPNDNKPLLIPIMVRRRTGDKSSSESLMYSLMYMWVDRPQWVTALLFYFHAYTYQFIFRGQFPCIHISAYFPRLNTADINLSFIIDHYRNVVIVSITLVYVQFTWSILSKEMKFLEQRINTNLARLNVICRSAQQKCQVIVLRIKTVWHFPNNSHFCGGWDRATMSVLSLSLLWVYYWKIRPHRECNNNCFGSQSILPWWH